MGLPLCIYDGFPLGQERAPDSYPTISEYSLSRIAELFDSRQLIDRQPRCAFETSDRVELETFNLQGMNRAESQVSPLWMFYSGTSLILYHCRDKIATDFSHLASSPITCVDCFERANRLWFIIGDSNGFHIICCFKSTGDVVYEQEPVHLPSVVQVSASFLPEYPVIVTQTEMLVYSDHLESLFREVENTHHVFTFPNVVTYNNNGLELHCFNVLTRSRITLEPNLKSDETIVNVNSIAHSAWLIETDQRFLSISQEHQSLVSHITSQSQAVFKNNQLYVIEHHLYATALTIYRYSTTTKQWQLQNYFDLMTKFNVNRVDAMTVVQISATSLTLAILLDRYIIYFQ